MQTRIVRPKQTSETIVWYEKGFTINRTASVLFDLLTNVYRKRHYIAT